MSPKARPVVIVGIAVILSSAWSAPVEKGAAPKWIPTVQKTSLDNGLTLLTSHLPTNGAATVGILIRAGSACDPVGKAGLATMMATAVLNGPEGTSAEDFAARLNLLCSRVQTEVTRDFTLFLFDIPSSDIAGLIGLVAPAIIRPALNEANTTTVRNRILAQLHTEATTLSTVLNRNLYDFVFAGHPYGSSVSGTEASLNNISVNDMIAFHKDYYGSNNTVIAVTGDISGMEIPATVRNAFGRWTSASKTATPVEVPGGLQEARIRLVNWAGSPITQLCLARPAKGREVADYVTLLALGEILGGGPQARLQRDVATKIQGCHHLCAAIDFGAVSTIRITAACQNKDTPAAIARLNESLNQLAAGGVTEDELKFAQRRLRLMTMDWMATPNALARTLLTWQAQGIDPTRPQTFIDQVDKLTTTALSSRARQILKPEEFALIVMGDRSTLAEDLRRFADVEVVEFTGEIPVPAMRTVLKKITQ
ncbi:MAG: insulinase family protein [candidate division KSB1 bacterium]|nr:insulinase family protein [candidate division KSB1 bacterium]